MEVLVYVRNVVLDTYIFFLMPISNRLLSVSLLQVPFLIPKVYSLAGFHWNRIEQELTLVVLI